MTPRTRDALHPFQMPRNALTEPSDDIDMDPDKRDSGTAQHSHTMLCGTALSHVAALSPATHPQLLPQTLAWLTQQSSTMVPRMWTRAVEKLWPPRQHLLLLQPL